MVFTSEGFLANCSTKTAWGSDRENSLAWLADVPPGVILFCRMTKLHTFIHNKQSTCCRFISFEKSCLDSFLQHEFEGDEGKMWIEEAHAARTQMHQFHSKRDEPGSGADSIASPIETLEQAQDVVFPRVALLQVRANKRLSRSRSRSKERQPAAKEGNEISWALEGRYRRMLVFDAEKQITPCKQLPPWQRRLSQFQMHKDPDGRESNDIMFASHEVLPGSSHINEVVATAVTPRPDHFSTSASSSSHSGRTVEALLEAVPKETFRVAVPVSEDDPREHYFCHGPGCGKTIKGKRGKDHWRQRFRESGVIHWYCKNCWMTDNRVKD